MFIDQAVKIAIKFSMIPYENIAVVGETVNINFIENKGAAFGLTIADLLQRVGVNVEDDTAKLVLTLFSLLAVMLIAYFLQAVRSAKTGLPYFLALILGGAIGNIIDRVFYGVWFSGINDYEGGLLHGRVVDMFYVNLVHGKFLGMDLNLLPVFNIADAAITIGILAIILFQRRFFKKTSESQEEDSTNPLPESSGETMVGKQGLEAGE